MRRLGLRQQTREALSADLSTVASQLLRYQLMHTMTERQLALYDQQERDMGATRLVFLIPPQFFRSHTLARAEAEVEKTRADIGALQTRLAGEKVSRENKLALDKIAEQILKFKDVETGRAYGLPFFFFLSLQFFFESPPFHV